MVKKRPLTPERFINPPKKQGCSKCRQKGCRSCRGYTLKELARWQKEQANAEEDVVRAVQPNSVELEEATVPDLTSGPKKIAEMIVTVDRAATGTVATTTVRMTRTRTGRTSTAADSNKKRSLTPERFINPPKKVGCSKCRQKGCTRCRGYTLKEFARWQEEHGEDGACVGMIAGEAGNKDGELHNEKERVVLDSKTPTVGKDRAERVDDLSPVELEKTSKSTLEEGTLEVATTMGQIVRSAPSQSSKLIEPIAPGGADMAGANRGPRQAVMQAIVQATAQPANTTAGNKASNVPAPILIPENGAVEKARIRDRDETWWNPLDEAIVREAKGCLHVSYTGMTGLPSCRDKQVREISDWLNGCVKNTKGDALYISGVPGTGKTLAANAIVRKAVAGMQDVPLAPPVALSINCMRVETAKDVLSRIVAGFRTAALQTITGRLGDDPLVRVPENEEGIVLEGAWADLSPEEHLRKIVHHPIMRKEQVNAMAAGKKRRSSVSETDLVKQTGLIFLILDEIDGMLSGRNCEEIMGSLLALASSEGSRLIIIGIANSIDLMQQLTRPGAVFHRFNLKPKNIIFPTYLREQVSQLLQERLDALPGPVIDPKAVQFCARKIANGTGDMRRALEAASLSIDVAVKDAVNNSSNSNSNSAGAENTNANTNGIHAPVKRTVGMRQMGMALNKLSGGVGNSNEHVKAIKKLPVPQQLIMCAVSAMVGETFKARGIEDRVKTDNQPLLGMKISHNCVSLPTYMAPESAVVKPSVQLVTLVDIEQGQRSLCNSVGVEKYTPSEFSTAIEVLETMGLIQLSSKKAADKRSRVQLKISEDDVWLALSDVPVLKSILTKK